MMLALSFHLLIPNHRGMIKHEMQNFQNDIIQSEHQNPIKA